MLVMKGSHQHFKSSYWYAEQSAAVTLSGLPSIPKSRCLWSDTLFHSASAAESGRHSGGCMQTRPCAAFIVSAMHADSIPSRALAEVLWRIM